MQMKCTIKLRAGEWKPEEGLMMKGELITEDGTITLNVMDEVGIKPGDCIVIGPVSVECVMDVEVKAEKQGYPTSASAAKETDASGQPMPRRSPVHRQPGK